jgi:hypothetical protein
MGRTSDFQRCELSEEVSAEIVIVPSPLFVAMFTLDPPTI